MTEQAENNVVSINGKEQTQQTLMMSRSMW